MAGFAPTTLPRPFRNRALPWIVLLFGLVLSAAIWFSTRLELSRQDTARFERLKERVLAAIDARFRAADQALHGGRALVESTGELSKEQWARFVDSEWPFFEQGVLGIGYVQRVPRDQLDALEKRLQESGRPEFKAERGGRHPDVLLVSHIEPLAQNAAALGMDFGAVPERRAAAEQAMRSGATTITPQIPIVEGGRRVPGCLLL